MASLIWIRTLGPQGAETEVPYSMFHHRSGKATSISVGNATFLLAPGRPPIQEGGTGARAFIDEGDGWCSIQHTHSKSPLFRLGLTPKPSDDAVDLLGEQSDHAQAQSDGRVTQVCKTQGEQHDTRRNLE